MKNSPRPVLLIFSILIGILLATQAKLNLPLFAPVTLKSISDTKNELKAVQNEITQLEKTITQKQAELDVLKSISTGDATIVDILEADLKSNKIQSGYYTLQGQGIEIIMFDSLTPEEISFTFNDDIIHDIDILNIINDLKIAGAEAVSINDQRVISTSEIKCGGPIIRINHRSVGVPFVIRAIGDQQQLMAAINAPGSYGHTLKTVYNIGMNAYSKDKVVVRAHRTKTEFVYAKTVGEGD